MIPGHAASLVAEPAPLPVWAARAINLADPRLGAEALDCSHVRVNIFPDGGLAPAGRHGNGHGQPRHRQRPRPLLGREEGPQTYAICRIPGSGPPS